MTELEKKFAQRGTNSKVPITSAILIIGGTTSDKHFNPYTEFPEFTRKEIKNYETTFKTYDTSKDGFLGILRSIY
jgi:inorganic pyrophosphatase